MTTDDWREVLGGGLAVNLELPVAPSAGPPSGNEEAAQWLERLALLEDGALAGRGKEESPSPEMQRLELKLDLLTDLVSSLLMDRVPRRIWVWVSRQGLVVSGSFNEPRCDCVELYPSRWLARPLVLEIGEPIRRADAWGARWRSTDPALRDALERWVFRLHRREVARCRLQDGGMAGEHRPSLI